MSRWFSRVRISPGCWPYLVVCLASFALLRVDRAGRPIDPVAVRIEGVFQAGGSLGSGEAPPGGETHWSSSCGSDGHRGTLELGPFPMPRRLKLLVAGYPRTGQNRLELQNVGTGQVHHLAKSNIGGGWTWLFATAPDPSWVGKPVLLRAVDDADEWGGWLAVGRPFELPWWAWGAGGLLPRVAAFFVVGLTLLLWVAAPMPLLEKWQVGPPPLRFMLGAAVAALAGFFVFWITLAHPTAGRMACWLGHAALAARLLLRRPRSAAGPDPRLVWSEYRWPALLALALGVLYLANLHLYTTTQSMSDLAADRFGVRMPLDNDVPQVFAQRLLDGHSPRPFLGDWLSSDRPPLQSGWVLLLRGPAEAMGANQDTTAQVAGLWFQLLWVPATWALLRCLGAKKGVAALIMAGIAPAGFYFTNSVFVWPKLGAGAFLLAAFLCWFLSAQDRDAPAWRGAVGGGLAGLGWLAHGGVAFALLALVPFALATLKRGKLLSWAAAALAFLAVASPWFAYQKFYDPPGNRLLKWHLAGQIPPDDRGTVETLLRAYRETPPAELWRARSINAALVLSGEWSDLLGLRFPGDRRNREFRATFFTFGWWNLGFLALAAAALVPCWRRRWPEESLPDAALATGWALLTILVWVALMFIPGSALIHHGSYTVQLVLFPILALALWRTHPLLFAAAALAGGVGFWNLWMTPYSTGLAIRRVDSLLTLLLAVLGLAALCRAAWRDDETNPMAGGALPAGTSNGRPSPPSAA